MALARKDKVAMHGYVQGAGRFLWITVLPSCVLVLLTGQELMGLLFSQSYSVGASFLSLQIFAFAFFVVAQALNEMSPSGQRMWTDFSICWLWKFGEGFSFLTNPLKI